MYPFNYVYYPKANCGDDSYHVSYRASVYVRVHDALSESYIIKDFVPERKGIMAPVTKERDNLDILQPMKCLINIY